MSFSPSPSNGTSNAQAPSSVATVTPTILPFTKNAISVPSGAGPSTGNGDVLTTARKLASGSAAWFGAAAVSPVPNDAPATSVITENVPDPVVSLPALSAKVASMV